MEITDILDEYGRFYRNGGQNAARLVQRAYVPSLTELLFGSLITDDTSYQMGKTELGRILQPFQAGWTPLGNLKATPVVLNQFPMKVDLTATPDQLEASWLGFLTDSNLDRAQWPFVRWFVETHVLNQIQEDYELNEIYAGKFVAPTNGVPGPAGTAMNGIRYLINKGIDDDLITPIALGAIPNDPAAFCEYVENFCAAFGVRYGGKAMPVCMNTTLARRYAKGRQKLYGTDTNFNQPKPLIAGNGDSLTPIPVEFTNHTVVGLPSMGSSLKIWATPAENRKRMAKKSVNEKMVRVESAKRELAIFTDFHKGIGFPLLQAVFTNDQDITL